MASATGVYIHPYFCFRKDVDSNYGFTCGFDTGAVAAVTAAPVIPHRPHVPAVAPCVHVPANATTGAAKITAHPGSSEVPEQLHVPEIFAAAATPVIQHDLPGVFGAKISVWTNNIWVALTKGKCFKQNSLKYDILHQNPGDGYAALFQILSPSHLTLSHHPSLLTQLPPVQLPTETVVMYF